MPIREDLSIDWAASPRIIGVVDSPLTVQDLYDTVRSRAASGEAMDDAEIIDGSGKDDLGGGVKIGLTVRLLNARVKFEARESPTVCTVRGGNLTAVDGNNEAMSPIEPSANVSVVIAQSTSASLLEGSGWSGDELKQIRYALGVDGEKLAASGGQLQFIHGVEAGRWRLVSNQMVFYAEDNEAEIARFDLLDEGGEPTMDPTKIVERRRA